MPRKPLTEIEVVYCREESGTSLPVVYWLSCKHSSICSRLLSEQRSEALGKFDSHPQESRVCENWSLMPKGSESKRLMGVPQWWSKERWVEDGYYDLAGHRCFCSYFVDQMGIQKWARLETRGLPARKTGSQEEKQMAGQGEVTERTGAWENSWKINCKEHHSHWEWRAKGQQRWDWSWYKCPLHSERDCVTYQINSYVKMITGPFSLRV